MSQNQSQNLNELGIDLSKETFDVMLRKTSKERIHAKFENNKKGFDKLGRWLKKHDAKKVHACMEATNNYWEDLSEYLYEKGHTVSVVNPRQIKGFATSQLKRNKTDKLDSEVILDYCIKMSPKAWTPPTPEQRQLRSYMRHRDALIKTRTQQKNRLKDCKDEYVRKSIQSLIDSINKQIKDMMQKVNELVKDNELLNKQKRLLISIKGIGNIVALTIMAEMPDIADYESAHAAAADIGVTPAYYESGDTIRRTPHISKIGKSAVRGVLYLPAMNAIRTNPVVKALADRLVAKGKNGKVIIVAAMRKLIHLAYGVLKNQTPFNPEWQSKPNPKPVAA